MIESVIERYLCKKVKEMGGLAIKLTSPNFAGLPDRIVLIKGKALLVELKAPNKKPRPLQRACHNRLEKVGFSVLVIDSIEGVNSFLEEVIPSDISTAQIPGDSD